MGDISNGIGISLIRSGDFKVGAPGLSAGFLGLSSITQRIFITADPILETHYTMESAKTFAGNFRVSALCILPAAATTVTLFGQAASASNYIKVLSTGFASINIGGSVVTSTVLATKGGILQTYGVELSGDDFLFQENGVTIDTITDAVAAANSLILDTCCQSLGADFYVGTYADPKLTDLVTLSNSESWRIDKSFAITTEQSSSNNNLLTYLNADSVTRELFTVVSDGWIGVEVVVNGGFNSDTDWTKGTGWSISGGLAVSVATTNTNVSNTAMSSNDNVTYRTSFEITAYTSGNVRMRAGSFGSTHDEVGVFEQDIVSTSSSAILLSANFTNGFVGSADNLSVKRFLEVA